MRLTATALATILAVLVLSETRPTLSGMTSMPPCELAPQVPATTTRPPAPKRLRIVPGVEELLQDLFVSGPYASADTYEGSPNETAAAIADPHAYYTALASRGDCFAAYSLRNAAQVEQYRADKSKAPSVFYLFPKDPDPRQQDGMKIVIPDGSMGLPTQVRLPIGPSLGKHVLVTFDMWFGKEFNQTYSRLSAYKGTPAMFHREGDVAWTGMRTNFAAARSHEHNLPAGGPYVAMTYAQGSGKGGIVKTPKWWIDSMSGYPRLTLPYDAPANERRAYVEGIAPVDSSVDPSGAEFGVVGERWTRYWHYFERVPSEDWISGHADYEGQMMSAYKWTYWAADTVRSPMRVVNEAIIGMPASLTRQIVQARTEFGAGNVNNLTLFPGRGDLIAYSRNWVALHGTQKADVLAMLQKPVN